MANVKKNYVLDEKAVIAFLKGESSASYLISLFKDAEAGKVEISVPISSYGFIFTWAQKAGFKPIKIYQALSSLPISIYNFEEDFIEETVNFHELHQEYDMTQAILLTLAKRKLATLVTGDKNLKLDDPTISISWV